jgi:hypothetical protein
MTVEQLKGNVNLTSSCENILNFEKACLKLMISRIRFAGRSKIRVDESLVIFQHNAFTKRKNDGRNKCTVTVVTERRVGIPTERVSKLCVLSLA